MKIEEKILTAIRRYDMLADGDTVVVGVSGGADSMALLHFFNKISSKKRLNISILCAHVHHGIRGAEADRDEAFVRDFCEKQGIAFRCAHYDVPSLAEACGESEEACGRRLRYEFFSSLAQKGKIATAHTADDCAETFLFNLARGTGLKGLTGIPPVRGNIIRPLITCVRSEIEAYLHENGVSYVTDSTNLTDEYARNKIRHSVVPVLHEINAGFPVVFQQCLSVLQDSEAFLEKTVGEAFDRVKTENRFSVPEIAALDKGIRDRVLMRIAVFFGAKDVGFRHVALLSELLEGSGAVNLPGNVTVCRTGEFLGLPKKKPEKASDFFLPVRIGQVEYPIGQYKVVLESIDKKEFSRYNSREPFLDGFCDAACIQNAVFRFRRDADRFRYPNAAHSKSLKQLFQENGISSDRRYSIPMLADENQVLWIYGIGVSDAAKVTPATEYIYKIIATE